MSLGDTDIKDLKKINFKMFNFSGIISFFMNFLVPLVCLVGIGGLVLLVFLPSYREIPQLEADLLQKQKLSKQLDDKVDSLNELVDFKPLIEEYSQNVNRALVSEPLIPELLGQVDMMVREAGLEVGQLSYSKRSSSGTSYDIVGVALTGTGDGPALLRFMESTEKASRLIVVDDFRYTGGEKGESLNVSFSIGSPYLNVESDAVTDDPVPFTLTDPEFKEVIDKVNELNFYAVAAEDINLEDFEETEEAAESEESAEGEPSVTPEVNEEPVPSPVSPSTTSPSEGADTETLPESTGGVE